MDEQTPEEIAALIEEILRDVIDAYDVAPDFCPETLPLVDQLVRDQVAGLPQAEREHKLAAVGAYFGEVMRRHLDGRWVVVGPAHAWRVELTSCFLYFRPVGMAAETLAGCELEAHDGSFGTLNELRDELAAVLEQAAPLAEDEYYSLAGRADILELVADWLIGRRLASDEDAAPARYTAEDYAQRIDDPLFGTLPEADEPA